MEPVAKREGDKLSLRFLSVLTFAIRSPMLAPFVHK